MKMSGEQVIPAPQARVWEALNDPEILRQSIPGCQEMVKRSPTEFSAKVMAKVGPVKANFAGDVTLSQLDPPNSYVISGQGTGGAAGFAEGGAAVRLEDAGGQTRLVYDVDAKVGGKLAQIGSRLIDSTARRMADDFFKRFAEAVTSSEARIEPVAAAVVEPAAAVTSPARKTPAKATAARKTPAKKTAAKKSTPTRSARKASAPPGSQDTPPPPPPVMPETVAAAPALSAADRAVPGRAAHQEPAQEAPSPGPTIWWIVGAGVVALLVILVLANV
jgi:carbon monoxide dehydrogenase subunit G